ncbi:Longitudinals lacking protein, isoforms A/B/D/L [Ooceraea biroi]|uniref:Longitudinals lacking protein, isoforms A/B/D/L n=1 Tax=Ooceraea biroi TaxID=2015173 RepID=A0A026W8B0_OOCBI|nr:Longitudinals lacking protein, isoforms A/B/D/L [Ooceraea biroi]
MSIILFSFLLLGFDPLKTLDDTSHPSVKNKKFPCPNCPSAFGQKPSLTRHLKYECGQEPRFQCPYCHFRSKKTSDVYSHVRRKHVNYKVFAVDIHGELVKNLLTKTHWL